MAQLKKRGFSIWVLVALIFMQLAQSAYACPMMAQTAIEPAMAAGASSSPDDMDMAQPGLCQNHCEYGQQNVNDASSPWASLIMAPSFVAFLPVIEPVSLPPASFFPALIRATAPPISIRNCCFRI
ncbi:MAG TPA: hypothetical protein VF928_06685 [Usitatibacteraceae bacterium]